MAVNAVIASRLGLLGGYGYGGTTPPTAPLSVEATGACDSTQVVWGLPASDGGSPITGYVIRVREGETIVATDTVGAGTFTDTISGLTDGTNYSVTVAAVNTAGEGPESVPALVIPECVPSKPLNVVPTAQCGGFGLTWMQPLSDGGHPIQSYVVWVRNGGQLVATDRVDATQLGDLVSNLTIGTSYTVTVSAANSVGVGPPSDPVTVSPHCGPSAPGVPIGVIGSPMCGGAELDWNAPLLDGGSPITGYVVFVRSGGSLVATDLVNGSTYTDAISGLVTGNTYDVSVAAVSALGVGAESSPVQIVPDCSPAPPSEPLGVIASALCSAIGIDWNGPATDGGSPVTGYIVFVRSSGTLVATDLVDGATFTDTINGLTNGTPYDVTVAAVNANGVSAESGSVQVAPDCAPTPPTQPLSVFASPLCSAIQVDWNGPTSDGGSPVTGYTVFVRSNGSLVASDVISDPNTFTDTINGLTNGTPYDVTVAATNAVGTGPESDSVQIAPDCPATVPDPPVTISAAAQCEALNIGWGAPANDGGLPITSYTVYVRNGEQTFTDTVGSSTFADTISGLTDGTSYDVTVVATNSLGDSVESSPPVSATPVCVPTQPLAVTAAPLCDQASIGWNAPASDSGSPITSYTVFARSGSQTVTDTVGGSTFTDTLSGLTAGATYSVTVAAQNAVGAGLESSPAVTVTPICVPSAPLVTSAAAQCESTLVNWNAPLNDGGATITGYTVFARAGSQTISDTVGGSTFSDTLTGLTDGTSYSVTVLATNAAGDSAESSPPVTVTPVCAPTVPLSVTAAPRCESTLVGWNTPANIGGSPITGYTVYVRSGSTIVHTDLLPANALSDTVGGLTDGSLYSVTVVATNAIGSSAESSAVNVTPICVTSAPLAVAATAQCAGALVTWNAPAFLGGTSVTSYTLNVFQGVVLAKTFTVGGSTLTDTIAGLQGGTLYSVTVSATNAAGTSQQSAPAVFTTTCVPTTLTYTGSTERGLHSPIFTVSAQLSSSVSTCRTSQPIVFTFDRNPVTQAPGPFTLATLTTTPSGQTATAPINASSWQGGRYLLTASYAGTPPTSLVHCAPSTALAQVTVINLPTIGGGGPPPPIVGPVAGGAGTIPVNGGTTFIFGLQLARGATHPTGQFALFNGRTVRVTGALTGYSNSGGVGTATGVGDVYYLNRFHFWQLAAHSVAVTLTFTAGGAGAGTLGIQIGYSPVPPQPALPNTPPIPLSGGTVQIFH